jgi:predicted ATPase/class 3 adenylate cyclase
VQQAPSGTVTFLFTDIEGSTRLWETDAASMRDALARHDEVLRSAITANNGHVFATGGDGFAAAFPTAADALRAAATAQQQLQAAGLPSVRMGAHTGEAVERDGDYFGPTVNRTARLMAIAHGGQVLVSQATERMADSAELRDLGEHRLRDLLQPERVFQLCVDRVANDFPPLKSVDALPTNLPIQLTTFVGRDNETKQIVDLIGDHRLVTITGVGGVGKTRLALQCAAELLPEFRDGVWLAELAQAEDDAAFPDVLAVALRAPSRPGKSLLDSVVEYLQPRELLLVTDNCEHLLSIASDFVERVLRTCPGVRVLATSREGLGIPGEQLWPLRSLGTPHDSGDVVSSDAAQLFLDRATSVDPLFVLDDTNAPFVADICRRLDGIPLAIELAAARVGAMGPADIAARLDERFRLLTGGRRRAVERHHTLRAAVDWSYQLLDDAERAVFDRLGVFVGSFDTNAARVVAAGEDIDEFDVIDALGELVAKSMVTVERTGGSSRYQLLETLRQYALEQLNGRGETDDVRERHAAYFAAIAEDLGPQLLGPNEIVARARFVADLDNFRAAVGWAIEGTTQREHDLGVRIVGAVARETVLNRAAGIGSWADRVLAAVESSDNAVWYNVVTGAAYNRFHRGDLEDADELARRAYEATREERSATAVWARMAQSNVSASRGDLETTITILSDILSWIEPCYDDEVIRPILALYTWVSGDHERTLELSRAGLERARSGGQPSSLALALYAHAMAVLDRDPETTKRECQESLMLTDAGASDVVYANVHGLLARAAEQQNDPESAIRFVIRNIEYADMVGDRPPMIDAMFTSARLLARSDLEKLVVVAAGIRDGWWGPMSQIVRPNEDIPADALERARAEIGDARFSEAWARGAEMSYDELIAFTLDALRPLLD